MRNTVVINAVLLAVAVAVAPTLWGQVAQPEPSPEAQALFPPRVVKTEPANLAEGVDFSIHEIKVTFDRRMQTEKAWSWMMHQNIGVYPGYRPSSDPKWEEDGKTCVLPVKLSPDTLYAVGANSFRHTGFKDTTGKVAVPYVWVFRTRKAQ